MKIETSWRNIHDFKLVTAEQAMQMVNSGDRVVVGSACGEPKSLMAALAARGSELKAVEIVQLPAMEANQYVRLGMEKTFRYNALFVSPSIINMLEEQSADYTPCFFSEIPYLFRNKVLPVDVALIQVTPPDEQGFCSYGIAVDYTKPAAECARIVIAQMNGNMPRTGGARIALEAINYIVEKDEPILELNPVQISEVEKQIGKNIAALIPDGATLRLGIGAVDNAVTLFLQDKKDLGIHSEVFSDHIVSLAQAGVITNRKKTINAGKFCAAFLLGTCKTYDFVHNNPDVEMHSLEYINDPYIIGQHEKFIAVNSALQVDLTGQVNAETIDSKQVSGAGSLADFVRGASRSFGGKSIIALPSTTANGQISNICCELDRGAAIAISRNEVHYVVTEYGVAELKGRSLRQRAQALIAVSHPEFRERLTAQVRNF
jgi:4-hydroxybutyrate CoA-transferase